MLVIQRFPHTSSRESRRNTSSTQARAALHLALEAVADDKTVCVLTPYASQARLLRAELGRRRELRGVKVGTVHKSQGQEADVVIYSLVDARSWFIMDGPIADRLNNVAISRTRHQLIFLAQLDAMRENPYLASFANHCLSWTRTWDPDALRR